MRTLTTEEREARWRTLPMRRKRVEASRVLADASGPVDNAGRHGRPTMYQRTNGIIRPGYFKLVNWMVRALPSKILASLILSVSGQPNCLSNLIRITKALPRHYVVAFQGHRQWRKALGQIINSSDGTIHD